MKKTFKSALSLLFVLIFVFQAVCSMGISAYAAEDPTYTIEVDGKKIEKDASVNKNQLKEGVEVRPYTGYFIEQVKINDVDVTGYMSVDRSQIMTLSAKSVKNLLEKKEALDKANKFTFTVKMTKNPSHDVTVELDGKTIETSRVDFAADNSRIPEGLALDHWIVEYDNGATGWFDVEDEYVCPFMDCEITTVYRPIYAITFKADAVSKQFDGTADIPQGLTVTSVMYDGSAIDPSEVSLSGVSFSIDDQWVGTKDIVANTYDASVYAGGDYVDDEDFKLYYTPGQFSIIGHDVVVKAVDVKKEYDGGMLYGDITGASGLMDGDYVAFGEYPGATWAPVNKTYVASEFKNIVIKDAGGNDVTGLYNILYDDTPASYVIGKSSTLKVKFVAKDVSAAYCGKPVDGEVKLVDSKLEDGVYYSCTFKYANNEHTNVGKRNYSLESIRLFKDDANKQPVDITDGYDITIDTTEAELNITKRPATITVKNVSKEFDGTLLWADNCTVEGLCKQATEGVDHVLDTSALKYSDGILIGTAEASILPSSVVIRDGSGNDVTFCYDVKCVPGKVTVSKLQFTVTAGSRSKKYDGTPLESDNSFVLSDADKEKLAKVGWTLKVTTKGSQLNIGSSDVTIESLDVYNSDNQLVDIKYYEPSMKPGTLTVERDPLKATVTITIDKATKVYDATPLEVDPAGFTISDNLPNGYSIFVVPEPTYITAAGTKTIGVQEYIVYKDGKVVFDSTKDKDLSILPFNIEIKNGSLTVTKYPIKITAKSGTKKYDGKEYVLNSCTITAPNDRLASQWHEPTVTIEAQDENGNPVKAVNVGKYYNVITNVVIRDGNKDVTANYDITTVNGTLTINKTGSNSNNPKTGDESNIGLWATVLAVSAVAVLCVAAIAIVKNKRKG